MHPQRVHHPGPLLESPKGYVPEVFVETMKSGRLQSGFTLIETLVAMAITAILLAMAVPAFRSLTLGNRIAAYANEFQSTLSFARSEALQRSTRVAVCTSTNGSSCSIGGTWTQGWIVFTDSGTLGTVDGTDQVLRYREALKGQVTMVGNSLMSAYVAYLPSGLPSLASLLTSATQTGTIAVCETTSLSVAGRDVVVNVTGRPAINSPSATCP